MPRTTPEGKIKERVKKLLKEYKAYYHMPVQNGMGAPTLDFIGCHGGIFFAIETKAPGKLLTARQMSTKTAMERAGGCVFVVSGENSLENLEDWLGTFE